MTLRPVAPVRMSIPPQEGWLPFELPIFCQVPNCRYPKAHQHHIVPRSRTGGPKRYVTIDGLVTPNVCGLCLRHHEQVTGSVGGHQARIGFPSVGEIEAGLYTRGWLWYTRAPWPPSREVAWELLGPLDPVIDLT